MLQLFFCIFFHICKNENINYQTFLSTKKTKVDIKMKTLKNYRNYYPKTITLLVT